MPSHSHDSPTLSRAVSARSVAQPYLPSRYHYWYAVSKVATDPLYAQVQAVLAPTHEALLDIGCGIGLLALYLREGGVDIAYRGIDIDAQKIAIARVAAAAVHLDDVQFDVADITRGWQGHRGSVAMLDVLQYLDTSEHDAVLDNAAKCMTSNGKLLIRAGIDDGSWRAAFTRGMDHVGHAIRWMKTPPRSQPTRAELAAQLARHGLICEFQPLWGRTPFNNWLVMASR